VFVIVASNGVVHLIDTVLIPPSNQQPTTAVSDTIVDIAVRDGRFTQLVAAVTSANLADDLSGQGPLTVFAPRA
jgi:transforming growth factor-beta-induced protein